ncbi:MAG: hypothetical protein EOO20_26395, partial [Chryseobacterium sp.]
MPLKLTIPRSVNSNSEGFRYFAQLAADTMIVHSTDVILDFTYCRWFDGNLCAVLGNILDGLVSRGNSIQIINLHQNQETAFTRNQFLRNFQDERVSMDSLTIPYSQFQLKDEQKAMDFIKRELFDKPNMPQMSDDAKKLVLVSIFEICVNAITHGECTEVYVCGQIYPTRIPPEVSLSFSDLGRTIKANVNDHRKTNDSGNKTILWALEERNTTKLVSSGEPGGIGLKLLQDLINLNKEVGISSP